MLNTFILQGVIATKVTQENTCYISIMNRTEMPSFENVARLAAESRVRFQRISRFLGLKFKGWYLNVLFISRKDEVVSSERVSFSQQ